MLASISVPVVVVRDAVMGFEFGAPELLHNIDFNAADLWIQR